MIGVALARNRGEHPKAQPGKEYRQ